MINRKTLAALFLIFSANCQSLTPTATPQPQNGPLTDCGAVPPASVGVTYKPPPNNQPPITQDQAITLARSPSRIPDPSTALIKTRYVLFSANAPGVTTHVDIPAWVVSFCAPFRAAGGLEPANAISNHEMNIVVNAQTGELLQSFYYR